MLRALKAGLLSIASLFGMLLPAADSSTPPPVDGISAAEWNNMTIDEQLHCIKQDRESKGLSEPVPLEVYRSAAGTILPSPGDLEFQRKISHDHGPLDKAMKALEDGTFGTGQYSNQAYAPMPKPCLWDQVLANPDTKPFKEALRHELRDLVTEYESRTGELIHNHYLTVLSQEFHDERMADFNKGLTRDCRLENGAWVWSGLSKALGVSSGHGLDPFGDSYNPSIAKQRARSVSSEAMSPGTKPQPVHKDEAEVKSLSLNDFHHGEELGSSDGGSRKRRASSEVDDGQNLRLRDNNGNPVRLASPATPLIPGAYPDSLKQTDAPDFSDELPDAPSPIFPSDTSKNDVPSLHLPGLAIAYEGPLPLSEANLAAFNRHIKPATPASLLMDMYQNSHQSNQTHMMVSMPAKLRRGYMLTSSGKTRKVYTYPAVAPGRAPTKTSAVNTIADPSNGTQRATERKSKVDKQPAATGAPVNDPKLTTNTAPRAAGPSLSANIAAAFESTLSPSPPPKPTFLSVDEIVAAVQFKHPNVFELAGDPALAHKVLGRESKRAPADGSSFYKAAAPETADHADEAESSNSGSASPVPTSEQVEAESQARGVRQSIETDDTSLHNRSSSSGSLASLFPCEDIHPTPLSATATSSSSSTSSHAKMNPITAGKGSAILAAAASNATHRLIGIMRSSKTYGSTSFDDTTDPDMADIAKARRQVTARATERALRRAKANFEELNAVAGAEDEAMDESW